MRKLSPSIGLVVAATGLSSTAFAGFTNVGLVPAREHSQERILETLYGGDFYRTGADFFNGTITVRRVDDTMTITPAMSMARGTIGDTTDETWAGAKFTARAVAKFSDNTQNLAIDGGNGLHHLFSAFGYGYSVTGSATFDASNIASARFVRSGDSGTHSSRASENSDGRDHMITYEVLGLSGVSDKVWVMFWEDLNKTPGMSNKRTYADYNDLVVETRATAVPLPAGVWAALALGGAAFSFKKRIRKIMGA
jgi:hypothetical protein